MEEQLIYSMVNNGIKSIDSYLKITVADKAVSLGIADEDSIPMDYKKSKVSFQIDLSDPNAEEFMKKFQELTGEYLIQYKQDIQVMKKPVLDALKEGKIIPGAYIVDGLYSLRIKKPKEKEVPPPNTQGTIEF